MDDVRRTTEERAKRPKIAPVGARFESERQRSKNALVKQLDSMDGRNVRKIAAVADAPQEEKILRVAAYCRVSTDDIDQAISIHLQIQEYKKKILTNPNWKYVGTYVWYHRLLFKLFPNPGGSMKGMMKFDKASDQIEKVPPIWDNISNKIRRVVASYCDAQLLRYYEKLETTWTITRIM